MGEEWILKLVRSCGADGYLMRNYDHLRFFANDRRVGDYSLNIANHLAADYFKNHFALARLTPSYDLNFVQLEALLQADARARQAGATLVLRSPSNRMLDLLVLAGTDVIFAIEVDLRSLREAATQTFGVDELAATN